MTINVSVQYSITVSLCLTFTGDPRYHHLRGTRLSYGRRGFVFVAYNTTLIIQPPAHVNLTQLYFVLFKEKSERT